MKHEHAYVLVVAFVALAGLLFVGLIKPEGVVVVEHTGLVAVSSCGTSATQGACTTCCQTASQTETDGLTTAEIAQLNTINLVLSVITNKETDVNTLSEPLRTTLLSVVNNKRTIANADKTTLTNKVKTHCESATQANCAGKPATTPATSPYATLTESSSTDSFATSTPLTLTCTEAADGKTATCRVDVQTDYLPPAQYKLKASPSNKWNVKTVRLIPFGGLPFEKNCINRPAECTLNFKPVNALAGGRATISLESALPEFNALEFSGSTQTYVTPTTALTISTVTCTTTSATTKECATEITLLGNKKYQLKAKAPETWEVKTVDKEELNTAAPVVQDWSELTALTCVTEGTPARNSCQRSGYITIPAGGKVIVKTTIAHTTQPLKIEAESFDQGAEGTTFHEIEQADDPNKPGPDIGLCTGSNHLGWTRPEEWVKYTIDVPATGDYDIHVRGGGGPGVIELSLDTDTNLLGTLTLHSPAGGCTLDKYATTAINKVRITEGEHTLKMLVKSAADIDFIEVLPHTADITDANVIAWNDGCPQGWIADQKVIAVYDRHRLCYEKTPGKQALIDLTTAHDSCPLGYVKPTTGMIDGVADCHSPYNCKSGNRVLCLRKPTTGGLIITPNSINPENKPVIDLYLSSGPCKTGYTERNSVVDCGNPGGVNCLGVTPLCVKYDLPPATSTGGTTATPITIEAESYTGQAGITAANILDCSTGAGMTTSYPAYSGCRLLAFTSTSQAVEYKISVPEAGSYELAFRARKSGPGPANINIYLDQTNPLTALDPARKVTGLNFGSEEWGLHKITATLPQAGENKLQVASDGRDQVIDKIEIKKIQ